MRDHKGLEVWKTAMVLVRDIYKMTDSFPPAEAMGLTNQIRRSAVSIPSNIAEGAARQSTREFIKHLFIAAGSAAELETQILIAQDLGYLRDADSTLSTISSIQKMLYGLVRHYRERESAR